MSCTWYCVQALNLNVFLFIKHSYFSIAQTTLLRATSIPILKLYLQTFRPNIQISMLVLLRSKPGPSKADERKSWESRQEKDRKVGEIYSFQNFNIIRTPQNFDHLLNLITFDERSNTLSMFDLVFLEILSVENLVFLTKCYFFRKVPKPTEVTQKMDVR
jgi:hypothetical protein